MAFSLNHIKNIWSKSTHLHASLQRHTHIDSDTDRQTNKLLLIIILQYTVNTRFQHTYIRQVLVKNITFLALYDCDCYITLLRLFNKLTSKISHPTAIFDIAIYSLQKKHKTFQKVRCFVLLNFFFLFLYIYFYMFKLSNGIITC